MDFKTLSDKDLFALYEAVRDGKEAECELFQNIADELGNTGTVEGIKNEVINRWCHEQQEFDEVFKTGDTVWWYDTEESIWEQGVVVGVGYVDGKVDSIGIDFQDDGFDELDGKVVGRTLFHRKVDVMEFITKPNMVIVIPAHGDLPPVVKTIRGRKAAKEEARKFVSAGYPADSVMLYPEAGATKI